MSADQQQSWVENRAGGLSILPLTELRGSGELVAFFALRDLQVRYKQAVLGVLWVVLQPLVTVAAFTLAFDRLADVGTGDLPYPVFALAGLLAWTYVSQCVSRGSEVLVTNPALITKVYVPRLVTPIASLLPGLVDLGVGLVLLAVFCVLYGVGPGVAVLLAPVWLVLLLLTALGPVLLLAAVNVRFRDVRYLVPPLLQAMLFLSPVAYSGNGLGGAARLLYAANPVVGALELGRFVLVGAPWPGRPLAVSATSAGLLAIAGLAYFQHAQRSFADVI